MASDPIKSAGLEPVLGNTKIFMFRIVLWTISTKRKIKILLIIERNNSQKGVNTNLTNVSPHTCFLHTISSCSYPYPLLQHLCQMSFFKEGPNPPGLFFNSVHHLCPPPPSLPSYNHFWYKFTPTSFLAPIVNKHTHTYMPIPSL